MLSHKRYIPSPNKMHKKQISEMLWWRSNLSPHSTSHCGKKKGLHPNKPIDTKTSIVSPSSPHSISPEKSPFPVLFQSYFGGGLHAVVRDCTARVCLRSGQVRFLIFFPTSGICNACCVAFEEHQR